MERGAQRNLDRRINRQSQSIRQDKAEEQALRDPPLKPHCGGLQHRTVAQIIRVDARGVLT